MRMRFSPFCVLPFALVATTWATVSAAPQSGASSTQAVPLIRVGSAGSSGAAPVAAQPRATNSNGALATAADDTTEATLSPTARQALADALGRSLDELDERLIDALWFGALRSGGTSEPLLSALEEAAAKDAPQRPAALFLHAGILAREGDAKAAVDLLKDLIDELGDDGPGAPRARFEYARLEDARGRQKIARKGYEDLIRDLEKSGAYPEIAQRLRLRLALLDEKPGEEAGTALSELAREGDEDTQRRAAVVLGLRGEPKAALELFPRDEASDEPDTGRFRREARLAEWALQDKDAARAQSLAWDASRSAKLRRDRNYALALVVEAHRLDDSLAILIDRFQEFDRTRAAAGQEIDDDTLDIWIELLRETERVDEAITLFEERGAGMSQDKRSALIEMYREDRREDELVLALRREIDHEPKNLAWRESLSRYFLERGDRAAATAVWSDFVQAGSRSFGDEALLVGFRMLTDQGLDELAVEVAERAIGQAGGQDALAACLLLFGMHHERGDLAAAEIDLERMESLATPDAPERLDLAEAWERLGRLDKAVDVLERVVAVRGAAESGEDLAMHLAWLYSEVGDEERALVEWRALWLRVNAIARRRYVEDRMMTVAARLGSLADIAIDLESKLFRGEANEREAGLLVRLYTKVQDAVSATEVLEEFLARSAEKISGETEEETRRRQVAALEEKGRVYLACLDYYHFEETVRDLIAADPEGEPDYLRQLAMSQLERGRPDQARASLTRLREVEDQTTPVEGESNGDAAEFEAGVLSLAGLRDEAIQAYRIGIAANPDRIESWLLLGNLMKDNGQTQRAIQMFQQLAETADADDLFMIAVDGLLNLEAPAPVLKWARRATWERLAGRSDKAYLYQLSADLSEAAADPDGVLVALMSSLSIAGERRGSVLRELIDRTSGVRSPFGPAQGGDEEAKLAFSRRLLGLGEIVPPDVYLTLGASFLDAKDPTGAVRTFRKATEVPDRGSFERETARLFEDKGYPEEALAVYERVLSGDPTSAGLLVKVGELHERLGSDELAHELYARGVELLLARMPLVSTKEDERAKPTGAFSYWGARNVDDFDRYFHRAQLGFTATLDPAELEGVVLAAAEAAKHDLEAALASDGEPPAELTFAPRALHRARFARELALAAGRPELVAELDRWLLGEALPGDDTLLEPLLAERLERGQVAAARALLESSGRPRTETDRLRYLVGQGAEDSLPQRLQLKETRSLVLPLIIEGRDADIALLLARTDLIGLKPSEVGQISSLLGAAMFIGNQDLSLRLGREWIRLLFEAGTSEWQLRPVLDQLETVLGKEEFQSLCLYLAEKALADPDKGQAIMGYLPSLAKKTGTELFTTDQLFELLDAKEDLGYGYGLQSVLLLFGPEERPSALRSMLPRLRPTARARFLIDLVSEQVEPIDEAVGEVVADSFPAYLAEADDMLGYSISNLGRLERNFELGLRLVQALLKKDPESVSASAAEVKLLWSLERREEALERAAGLWSRIATLDDSDWMVSNARNEVRSFLIENDLPTILAEIAERLADDPQASAIERANLLFSKQKVTEAIALIEAAVAAEEPLTAEARPLLDRLATFQGATGATLHRLATLERALELVPDDQGLRRQLVGGWRALRRPAKALEFAVGLEKEDPQDALLAPFAGLNLPPGTMIIINGQTVVIGEEAAEEDRASIERIKEAADEGRGTDAALLLRRLWREFQSGITPTNRYGGFLRSGQGTPVWSWPPDAAVEAAPEAESSEVVEAPLSRGGLIDYVEPVETEPTAPVSAYERLATYDWGRREMQRILLTRSADALDADGTRKLIAGLLGARASEDPLAVRDELLTRLESGLAGKTEHIMLLDFLDAHPELVDARAEAILDELSRTLQAGDFGPLRALARLYARRGDLAEAARLYRWLATKVAAIGAWYGDEEPHIEPRGLFREVHEVLADDQQLLVAFVEDLIFFATAGSDPWSRGQQDRFALELWTEVLPPAEALARLQSLTDSISNTVFEAGPARDLALAAMPLYLKAGELERALVCLEVGLCTFDSELFAGVEYAWPSPNYPGNLNNQQLAALFPSKAPDFPDADAWYEASAAALVDWYRAGRITARAAARGVALASLRRHQQGNPESSPQLETLIQLALAQSPEASGRPSRWNYNREPLADDEGEPEPLSGYQMLDLLDAARFTGRLALADALERRLESTGRLPLGRVPAYLGRVSSRFGPVRALALGEGYLVTTHAGDLLATLEEAALRLGASARAAELAKLADDEQAARVALSKLEF